MFDTFIKLSEVPATREGIAQIVKQATKVDILMKRNEVKDSAGAYALNRSDELMRAIAGEMNQKGQTMWGLMSGVTKYTSHVMPTLNRENGRLESIYTGSAYELNNKAFATVRELARV